MPMTYNKNPISLREGKITIDGIVVADAVSAVIRFTPDTWTGRQLGERSPSTRWLGYAIAGTITRRRSTNWLRTKIKEYTSTGKTPEFILQGIADDKESDYYTNFGADVVTVVGCVLTGDLTLISLDSNGQVLDEELAFNGKEMV